MPADYLWRLLATNNDPVVAAFHLFQPGLDELQQEEEYTQNILEYSWTKQWPSHLLKKGINMHLDLIKQMFHGKEGLLWVQLSNYNYRRTALLLPKKYQKEALCEPHTSIFGGHDATLKTYIKIMSSCYWPGIYQDIKLHVQTCLTCQQRKWSPTKPTPLSMLPIPECMNWRIHADLFGPMLTANNNKKFVLCITDAFTKYAVVTLMQNKNAETVADAIFKESFCKFGIPVQIHTDWGKEFVNKLALRCWNYSMWPTIKLPKHTRSAIPKWKFSTKQ